VRPLPFSSSLSFPLVPTLLIENVPDVEQEVKNTKQFQELVITNTQTDDVVMSQSTGTRCVTLG
jgi:hypothetical protein